MDTLQHIQLLFNDGTTTIGFAVGDTKVGADEIFQKTQGCIINGRSITACPYYLVSISIFVFNILLQINFFYVILNIYIIVLLDIIKIVYIILVIYSIMRIFGICLEKQMQVI